MHDDHLPAEVSAFLRQAAAALPADVPPPDGELGLLFAAGLPAAPPPVPTRRPKMFQALSTIPAKLALAAVGMTFATSGLAAANALPAPVQEIAADVGDVIGVGVPVPDGTPADGTPIDGVLTDGTPIDGTPTEGTPTDKTPTDGMPTDGMPTDGTPTEGTPTEGTPTEGAPTDPAATLPPPATTTAEAAHIHDFDAACGNHGHYVSYVAKNGTEPSCATDVRTAATPAPTDPAAGGTTPDPTAAAAGTSTGSKPSKADRPAKAHKAPKAPKAGKATTKKAFTSRAPKGKGK